MPDSPPRARRLLARIRRDVAPNLVVAASYAVAGSLALSAATEHRAVSSLWPPAGIAFFALMRFGPRLCPGIALAAYVLNASNGIPTVAALVIAAGDTLEAVVGAALVTRVWQSRAGPNQMRNGLGFSLLAVLASTAIAATISIGTLALSGATHLSAIPSLWLVRWSGDAVGILVTAPALFAWSYPQRPLHRSWPRLEVVIVMTMLAVVTYVVFTALPMLCFAVFPLTAWIALRMGLRGATSGLAIVTIVSAACTLAGDGPFTSASPTTDLFALQAFLALLGVKCLLFIALGEDSRTALEQLRASEARYRMLAQHLPDGCVVLVDDDIRVMLAEGPALESAGFIKANLVGRTLPEVLGAEKAASAIAPLRAALAGSEVEFEFGLAGRQYLVRALPLDIPQLPGRGPMAMALALDVTTREAAQREVAESRSQLELLSRLLLTAQEDERRRVAREVHDELGQALTAVKIGLATSLRSAQTRGSLDSERHMRTAAATLDQAIAAVQRIVLKLRPGVLDSLGPVAAIEYAVQQFRAQAHLPVELTLPPESLPIDAERATALYRTVQEALTNVARHAHARSVAVSLVMQSDRLMLQVADDGRGIDDEQMRNPRSMGVLGMRERAAACGGWLTLKRADTGGTVVSLTMPLRASDRIRGIA